MSDFIYSSSIVPQGKLSAELEAIYAANPPEVQEFHGPWGSLAVSRSTYNGFSPIETRQHICTVIGGPVLYFRDNRFLTGNDPQAGTRAILERWQAGAVDWSEELSGPFAILIVDKATLELTLVTDLLLFIPVYHYRDSQQLMLGTHADALARAAGRQDCLDECALADFIVNNFITHPYSAYQGIRVCEAATEYRYQRARAPGQQTPPQTRTYWSPEKTAVYRNIGEAAAAFREGITGYLARVTEGMEHVAQFLSAGEDSRVIAAMLPTRLQRDAFIFTDSLNREARIAQRVADAYGIDLKIELRHPLHYLNILPEASRLVGNGHQYTNVHTVGLASTPLLRKYPAVFGGFLADTFLKGYHMVKYPAWARKFAFLPEVEDRHSKPTDLDRPGIEHLQIPRAELACRKGQRLGEALKVCASNANMNISDLYYLWPSVMLDAMPSLHANRRLFASFEPYMCKEAVKIYASVPGAWKLNRRLFHKAFRSCLEKSRSIRHPSGHYPYYPWLLNLFIQPAVWSLEKFVHKTGLQKSNPDPWGDWRIITHSPEWQSLLSHASLAAAPTPRLKKALADGVLSGHGLTTAQKVNFLQVCFCANAPRQPQAFEHHPLAPERIVGSE